MAPREYRITPIASLQQISAAHWDSLNPSGHVFSSYGFLLALEKSGDLKLNGWETMHLLIFSDDAPTEAAPLAALILYNKDNSMGEFVFDFAWADAYDRYGLPYYPKLLSGIPFTPVTGPRLLTTETSSTPMLWEAIETYLANRCRSGDYSSHHINFCNDAFLRLQQKPFAPETPRYWQRRDTQYHWHNQNYADFDDFLTKLSSKRRKNIRRERRIANETNIEMRTTLAHELPESDWENLYHCYSNTFLKRFREPPLSLETFRHWAAQLSEKMVIFSAHLESELIAAAICFRDHERLYGRYWGALLEADALHFELCYYRGIEFCISEGLQAFEPGAQGEHKIWRGFDPTPTYSLHYIAHPGMSAAIGKYLEDEGDWSLQRHEALQERSAYRQTEPNTESTRHVD